ncbi:MAG: LptF/LptG family permease [Planctomycetota bacterium]|jgi:lipopolysaccharide export LptBFGC system permease protein LptF
MIVTLHKYVFRELFKIFLLATVALTLILSLGSALRPIQEFGVGPRQVIHLMGYFLPIILTFVLPMAALFAASLVYGRFASDNELDACRASGISIITLVYPGLVLAVIVTVANLVLSFHVVPAFFHRADEALMADAKQILFRNIHRRGFYELPDGDYLIYADHVDQQKNSLSGVIATRIDKDKIEQITIAENAKVNFTKNININEVAINAYNTYQLTPSEKGGFYARTITLSAPFPSLLGDDIKYKNLDQMRQIQKDLMKFYPIEKEARDIYAQFTAELVAQDISRHIAENPDTFYSLRGDPNGISFKAANCTMQTGQTHAEKVYLSGDIVAVEFDPITQQEYRTYTASRATLHIEGDKLAPTLTLDIYNPTWRKPDGTEGLSHRRIVRGLFLTPALDLKERFDSDNILEIINKDSINAALQTKPTSTLRGLNQKLEREIRKTKAEIKSEMNLRLVFGIGCIPMILIGIGLGILLRSGHALLAFGVSCIPFAVLIIGILSGKRLTTNLGAQAFSGVFLMWGALLLLGIIVLVVYRKLLKY